MKVVFRREVTVSSAHRSHEDKSPHPCPNTQGELFRVFFDSTQANQ